MRAGFVRWLLVVFAVFAAIFSVEFFAEWFRLGRPGASEMSWAGVNNAKLVDVLSPMARAYNNILAMLLATIGLAIPLTANMHTPKLIEMFLRDRLNQFMLLIMALGAANVLFVAHLIGPEFAPVWAIRVAVYGALLGWAMLIPYFFYVVRFLDPSHVILRLRDQTLRTIKKAARGRGNIAARKHQLEQLIDQIGTITLKSLDRADRGVAREGIWAFKQILDGYGTRKAKMTDAWYRVDRGDFIGFSDEAIDIVNESRTWVEMKALSQMYLAYQRALSKAPDTVSSISDATRVIALRAHERGDTALVSLSIRFFNNFLREAIKNRDTHAVYDVFHEYRLLVHVFDNEPDRLREIARYFRYYSQLARAAGLVFAPQLAAFDLGYVVRRAYEASSPAASDLLDVALKMPHDNDQSLRSLAVKAKLILGGFLLEIGREDEAAKVRSDLSDVDRGVLAKAERDLLAAELAFFEVTDRQKNLEYVPPERRPHIRAFVASFDSPAAD